MNKFDPDYRVAPGETILEVLEDRGVTIKELASKLILTEEETNFLLKGEKALSPDIANVLEELFEVPVSFWLNLEKFYRKKKDELLSREE